MNTKRILSSSAIVFALLGASFTFMPAELMQFFGITYNSVTQLLLQILGGLYLAFAMLNWNNREQIIGGIYNRPLALANFMHAVIIGMALVKFVLSDYSSKILLILATVYVVYAVLFYFILFRHPKNLN